MHCVGCFSRTESKHAEEFHNLEIIYCYVEKSRGGRKPAVKSVGRRGHKPFFRKVMYTTPGPGYA